MNKFRIPRKAKKKIPKGMYCYTPIKFDTETGIYHIKSCAYYKCIKDENLFGYCSLLKYDEIMDQCKSCGVKYDFKKR